MNRTDLDGLALPRLPCACASLRRAGRAVTQLYESELRSLDLNTAQLTLLQALARAEPITQGSLGRLLALDSTTLSRTLRPLEKKGWIRSEPGKDRRERRLRLTKAGRTQLERADPAWERAQGRLKARLGAERWESLLADLSMLAGVAREA
ncbi:MAG: MarR family winged helix-turn-helix transcriptional regulator [Vicinamibacteria bacterium]